MKRKRQEEYTPVQFSNTMIQNPESALYDDVGYCQDFMAKHKDLIQNSIAHRKTK